jgi:hypothetical protein
MRDESREGGEARLLMRMIALVLAAGCADTEFIEGPAVGVSQPATIAVVGFGGDVDGVWTRAAEGCAEGVREAGALAVPGASSERADAFIIGTLTAKRGPSGTFARAADARLVDSRSRKSIRIVLVKNRNDDGFATGVEVCRRVVLGRE